MNRYRFDRRTKEQFTKDIRDGTIRENELIEAWLNHVERVTGHRPKTKRARDKGAKGEFLEDRDVVIDADFEVEGYGLVEVKFAKPLLTSSFHLKVDQVEKYIAQGASVLMVNGADTSEPEFAFIRVRRLRELVNESPVVDWRGFGNKKAHRISVKKVRWTKLLSE